MKPERGPVLQSMPAGVRLKCQPAPSSDERYSYDSASPEAEGSAPVAAAGALSAAPKFPLTMMSLDPGQLRLWTPRLFPTVFMYNMLISVIRSKTDRSVA